MKARFVFSSLVSGMEVIRKLLGTGVDSLREFDKTISLAISLYVLCRILAISMAISIGKVFSESLII